MAMAMMLFYGHDTTISSGRHASANRPDGRRAIMSVVMDR
jgi:hypothetical protein